MTTVIIAAAPALAQTISQWLDERASWADNEWQVNLIDKKWHFTFVDDCLATEFVLRWA